MTSNVRVRMLESMVVPKVQYGSKYCTKFLRKALGVLVMHNISNRSIRERCGNKDSPAKSGSNYLQVV